LPAQQHAAAAAAAAALLTLCSGPGCSSIGGGFMSELGPFYPTRSGTKLQANPYPWNDMANVLWLESPAFVGFSYSNSSADAIVGELMWAQAWGPSGLPIAVGFSYSKTSADAIVSG
jgi:serine carboxypeptidase-like clade 2